MKTTFHPSRVTVALAVLFSSSSFFLVVNGLNLVRCPQDDGRIQNIRRSLAESQSAIAVLQRETQTLKTEIGLSGRESNVKFNLAIYEAEFMVNMDIRQSFPDKKTDKKVELEIGLSLAELELIKFQKDPFYNSNIKFMESAKLVIHSKKELLNFYESSWMNSMHKITIPTDEQEKETEVQTEDSVLEIAEVGTAPAVESEALTIPMNHCDKISRNIPDASRENFLVSSMKVAVAQLDEQKALLTLKKAKLVVRNAVRTHIQESATDINNINTNTEILEEAKSEGADGGADEDAAGGADTEAEGAIPAATPAAPATPVTPVTPSFIELSELVSPEEVNLPEEQTLKLPIDKDDLDQQHRIAKDILSWNQILEKAVVINNNEIRNGLKKVWQAQEKAAMYKALFKQARAVRKETIANLYAQKADAVVCYGSEEKSYTAANFDIKLALLRKKAAKEYKNYVITEIGLEKQKWDLLINELNIEEEAYGAHRESRLNEEDTTVEESGSGSDDAEAEGDEKEDGEEDGKDLDAESPTELKNDAKIALEKPENRRLKLLWMADKPWNFIKFLIENSFGSKLIGITNKEKEVETKKSSYAKSEISCSNMLIKEKEKALSKAEKKLWRSTKGYFNITNSDSKWNKKDISVKNFRETYPWDSVTAPSSDEEILKRKRLEEVCVTIELKIKILKADLRVKTLEEKLSIARLAALELLTPVQQFKQDITDLHRSIQQKYAEGLPADQKIIASRLQWEDFIQRYPTWKEIESQLPEEKKGIEGQLELKMSQAKTKYAEYEQSTYRIEDTLITEEINLKDLLKKKALRKQIKVKHGKNKWKELEKLDEENMKSELNAHSEEYRKRMDQAVTEMKSGIINGNEGKLATATNEFEVAEKSYETEGTTTQDGSGDENTVDDGVEAQGED